MKEVAPGKKVVDLCNIGDNFVTEKVKNVFKKVKKMPKGLAFPTCVSINEVVCHFSPLAEDLTVVSQGDVVRFDVGVHVDGFIAVGEQLSFSSQEHFKEREQTYSLQLKQHLKLQSV